MATRKPEPEHISQQPFGDILAQFVGSTDSLGLPTRSTGMSPATRASRDKKKDSSMLEFDDLPSLDTGLSLDDIDEIDDGDYDENFDSLIEIAFQEDEDVALRNSLISMGRK